MRRAADERSGALFVRLPLEQAERLDRAAAALPARKKDLIAGLIARYVDSSSPEALSSLRELAEAVERHRPVEVDPEHRPFPLGRHSFRAMDAPEVLTITQAAELLAVAPQAILELAEAGALPGRKIAGDWRFARQALLDWLGQGDPP